jgi:SHS2 domain-containing protein
MPQLLKETNRLMAAFRKPYRLIKHTGDLGMEVRGRDLPDLFSQAGWSFFDILVEARRIIPNQERSISVGAPDLEALLVAWLGELLYIFETEQWVFGTFFIQNLTPQTFVVQAWGEPLDAKKHKPKKMIKAVTYHQLRIWEERGIWKARVIFDL